MSIPISNPLVVDTDDLAQIGYERMQAYDPTWQPLETDPAKRLVDAFAAMLGEIMPAAGDVPDDIIRYFGAVAYRTAPFAATSASTTSTWAMVDGAGYTIPAGTQVAIPDDNGNPVAFETQADVVVAPGDFATAVGEVVLVAITAGSAASGLTGTPFLLDRLSFVADGGIDLVITTSGGADAETTEDYTNRVLQLATIFAPRVILPADFANAVRLLIPGVQRALAIDEYNADTATAGVERCVSVFPVDADGANVGTPALDAARALLASMREQTFLSFVENPTRTAVTIDFAGKSVAGYDPTLVQAAAIAAIESMASPAFWGIPSNGDTSQWIDTPILRMQDVITALNNVDGFDHYTTLTLNGGTADITLTGPAALPTATVTGTVTAP